MKKAREAFVGAEAKSSLMDFPMPAMLGVEDPVEALLLILEKVVTESIALNAEEDAQLRAYPTVPLSPLSPARMTPAEVCAQVSSFLNWLNILEGTNSSTKGIRLVIRVLPFLTQGSSDAISLIFEHFAPALDPAAIEKQAEGDRLFQRLLQFQELIQGLQDDVAGREMCVLLVSNTIPHQLADFIVQKFPASHPADAEQAAWDTASEAWEAAVNAPAVPPVQH